MFDNKTPDEIGYFEADDKYGKTLLRQAVRTDTHVYRLVSGRVMADTSTLMHFVAQDDRVAGYKQERVKQRFSKVSHESLQLFSLLPEAVEEESPLGDIIEIIAEDDKRQ